MQRLFWIDLVEAIIGQVDDTVLRQGTRDLGGQRLAGARLRSRGSGGCWHDVRDFVEVSIRNFYELTRRGLHDEARYAFLWKILATPWAKGTLADYVGGCDFRVDVSSDSGGVRVVLDA